MMEGFAAAARAAAMGAANGEGITEDEGEDTADGPTTGIATPCGEGLTLATGAGGAIRATGGGALNGSRLGSRAGSMLLVASDDLLKFPESKSMIQIPIVLVFHPTVDPYQGGKNQRFSPRWEGWGDKQTAKTNVRLVHLL